MGIGDLCEQDILRRSRDARPSLAAEGAECSPFSRQSSHPSYWDLVSFNSLGAPAAIRNAGLIHSVYSTSFFNHALFTIGQRRELQRLIGQEAEALAFLFCVLDRAFLWARIMELREIPNRLTVARHDGQNSLRLSKKVVRDILMIECANLADQQQARTEGRHPG